MNLLLAAIVGIGVYVVYRTLRSPSGQPSGFGPRGAGAESMPGVPEIPESGAAKYGKGFDVVSGVQGSTWLYVRRANLDNGDFDSAYAYLGKPELWLYAKARRQGITYGEWIRASEAMSVTEGKKECVDADFREAQVTDRTADTGSAVAKAGGMSVEVSDLTDGWVNFYGKDCQASATPARVVRLALPALEPMG